MKISKMNSYRMAFLAGSTVILASHIAVASPYRHHHRHCQIETTTTLIGKTVNEYRGECVASPALALARTSHVYPLMSGQSYDVDYWQGGYVRDALVTSNYREDHINSCSGLVQWTSFTSGTPYVDSVAFSVDNPNLHDDVSASYNLVPMTDGEAAVALAKAKTACETAVP